MEIKKIENAQISEVIDLIWATFLQFEAPDYSEEGVRSFREFIEDKEIMSTLEFWGAYDNQELKGVIATNENRGHICCFLLKPNIIDKVLAENYGNIFWQIAEVKLLLLILLHTLSQFTTSWALWIRMLSSYLMV